MENGSSSPVLQIAQNASLIILSLLFLPTNLAILFFSYVCRLIPGSFLLRRRKTLPSHQRRTVLITGVSSAKGLGIARMFYLSGHRVLGADFQADNVPVIGTFSRALSACYLLHKPKPDSIGVSSYISNFLYLIEGEKIDLWINCSPATVAIEDSLAAEKVEHATKCKVIQFNSEITKSLRENHTFLEKSKSVGLPLPKSHQIISTETLSEILEKAGDSQYILKNASEDSLTQNDTTLLPRPTSQETAQHLSTLEISDQSPWTLQQHISGTEYCTHALVIRGQVEAFLAWPLAKDSKHYQILPADSALSEAMLKFTQDHAAGLGDSASGHLSFNFSVDESASKEGVEQSLFPIECHPEAQTAIISLSKESEAITQACLSVLSPRRGQSKKQPLLATSSTENIYFLGLDLITLLIQPLLHVLTGSLPLKSFLHDVAILLDHVISHAWKEAVYEIWDPLPFFWLYQVYWPARFFLAIRERKPWSWVDVKTAEMVAR